MSVSLMSLGSGPWAFALDACSVKMKNAAAVSLAKSLKQPVKKVHQVRFEMGAWTEAVADNHGSAVVAVNVGSKIAHYEVFAQQIGTGDDCNILEVKKISKSSIDPAVAQSEKYKVAIGEARYISEGDANWEVFYSSMAVGPNFSKAEVRAALGAGNEDLEILSNQDTLDLLDSYIDEDSKGHAPSTESLAYKNLKKAMLHDFADFRICRVGKADGGKVLVYLVGRRADGQLVGLKTVSFET